MTVPTERARSGPYAGNGAAREFAYRFRIDDARHLRVLSAAGGAESRLELDRDYAVTGVGAPGGGSVVLAAPLAAGAQLTILRDQPLLQELDLENQGPFFAEDLERALDHAAMRDQQLAEGLSRAVTVPPGESTAPRDYLAQMRALLAEALAAEGGASAVSVLTHGARGDGETNDLAAFQAARDRAVALGLDYVLVPAPPNPDDWYFLLGEIRGVADVTWRMEPGAAVNGSTNLFAEQRRLKGAWLWEPPVTDVVVKAHDDRYSHQVQVGTDLDGEWLLSHQFHPTERREGQDGQLVGLYRSTDGGEGLAWSPVMAFATDPAFSTNPLVDSEPEGQRFSLWRSGVINFKAQGLGEKLWVRYDHTLGSSFGGCRIAQKTAADGKFTNYGFFQLADGRIKLIRYGDPIPEGASWLIRHEGRSKLFPYCHGDYISSSGRLHLLWVLSPRYGGGQSVQRKSPCVLYSDNPGEANPEDIDWTLGPSIDMGEMDPANFWEWSIAEERPGFFVATMRRNESEGSTAEQEGRRHFIAHGDGVTFSGWVSAKIHAHRDRPQLVRLNHEHMAYVTLDDPNSRANTSVWLKRRGGAITPALTVGNNADFFRREQTLTLAPLDESVFSSSLDFSDAQLNLTHVTSAGDRLLLNGEGYRADWEANSLDLARLDFSVGDTLLGERDGRTETLFLDSPNDTVFELEIDLTAAAPLVRAFGAGIDDSVSLGSGGALIDTAEDRLTFQGSATDVDFLVVHQTGVVDSKVFLSPGDTLWDVGSASSSLTIAEGSFEARLVEGSWDDSLLLWRAPTVAVPPLDYLAATADGSVTLLMDRSADDRLKIQAAGGELTAVPTGWRHPETGALGIGFGAKPLLATRGPGATSIRFSLIAPEDFPRSDRLNVVPRRNAAVESGPGHGHVWDGTAGILELTGKASAGVDLPAGRWQVSGRLRLSALPSGVDRARLLQVGNFERRASLEAEWAAPYLLRGLYLVDAAAGARDLALGSPISRRRIDEVTEEGEGYGLADDVWIGWSFHYDSYRGEVVMEGETFPLQWPYNLVFGDGDLVSDAPTGRSLFVDVGGISVAPLPEAHRDWGRLRSAPHAPNYFLEPGLRYERERRGGNFPGGAPRALLPGWAVVDDGGCTVTPSQTTLSVAAANKQSGGWRQALRFGIEGAQVAPKALATGEVRLQFSWPGALSIGGQPWFVAFDVEDGLPEGSERAARDNGLAVRLYWVHNYGRPDFAQAVFPITPIRVLRDRRRIAVPLPVPQLEEGGARLLGPESYCALRFDVEAGRNANLSISRPDLYPGEAPRAWVPPDPYAPDRTRRLFYSLEAKTIGMPLAPPGRLVDASTAEFVVALPEMVRPPSLRSLGRFAFDLDGSLHSGTPLLVSATEELAWLQVNAPAASLTVGDAVVLKGVSAKVTAKAGDGVRRRFTAEERMYVERDDDLSLHSEDSGGSTLALTLYDDYEVRPSFAARWDTLVPTSGSSLLATDLEINSLTNLDLVHYSGASGEETLALGNGGFAGSLAPGGGATFTLLDGEGSGVAALSGHDYQVRIGARATQAEVLLKAPVAASATLHIAHVRESDAALQFDARVARPVWAYEPETTALASQILANGSSVTSARKDLMNRTIEALKEAGIWERLDLFYCFAAADETAALINWKDPAAFGAVAVNSPVFTAGRGFATDGASSHLRCEWEPGTDGERFGLDDGHLSAWCFSGLVGSNANYLWGASSSGADLSFVTHSAAGTSVAEVNSDGSAAAATAVRPLVRGYYAADRSGDAAVDLYGEGGNAVLRRTAGLALASAAAPTGKLFFGRKSSAYGQYEIAFGTAGGALGELQHRSLARIERRYLSEIGAL